MNNKEETNYTDIDYENVSCPHPKCGGVLGNDGLGLPCAMKQRNGRYKNVPTHLARKKKYIEKIEIQKNIVKVKKQEIYNAIHQNITDLRIKIYKEFNNDFNNSNLIDLEIAQYEEKIFQSVIDVLES